MARLLLESQSGKGDPRELKWGRTLVGRGSDNDVIIDHPSVSYHHCEFHLGLESLVLRDSNSTNGTFVNGQKISEVNLVSGQRVRFGEVQALVEWSGEQVIVPKIEVPRPQESVDLGNEVLSCRDHPTVPGAWHCPHCHQYFCEKCTRGVNIVGRAPHKLCPLCSSHVEPAPWVAGHLNKGTLWGRVKKAINRTIKIEPE